jgi:hypothetical protein
MVRSAGGFESRHQAASALGRVLAGVRLNPDPRQEGPPDEW